MEDSDAVASLSTRSSWLGKYFGNITRHSTVPHASVRVMCLRFHSPVRGNRKKSPAAHPQMYGFSTSEQESLVRRGANVRPSVPTMPSARRAGASSTPLQKLAAVWVFRRSSMAVYLECATLPTTASCSGVPGILSGAERPLRDPSGKSSQSVTCTRKELCDSSRSRVILPSRVAMVSATARACLDGGRQPKPPLSTRRPPMKSMTVPAPLLVESQKLVFDAMSRQRRVPAAASSGPTYAK